MGLRNLIAKGIKQIDKATKDLQGDITIVRWISQDVSGKVTYASVETYKAIVEYTEREEKTSDGGMVFVKAKVTILKPILAIGAVGRQEPIDTRDVITLPDGSSGPIVQAAGFADRVTGLPFFSEIWIGAIV